MLIPLVELLLGPPKERMNPPFSFAGVLIEEPVLPKESLHLVDLLHQRANDRHGTSEGAGLDAALAGLEPRELDGGDLLRGALSRWGKI